MDQIEKLRVLLPHWIEHNGEHAAEFRDYAERSGKVKDKLLAAAQLMEEANARLSDVLTELVLQRRMNASQTSSSGVRAFGLLIAALDVSEPVQQFVRRPSMLGQQLPQDSCDLRTRDLGHLFPPSPVADSTGRLQPARPS